MGGLLYWNLTLRCNLNCSYCFIGKDETLARADADLDHCISALPDLRQHFDRLILTGGEVLMLPGLFSFIARAKKLRFRVVIITNGVLLHDTHIADIISHNLDGVSVSLDAIKDEVNNRLRGKTVSVRENIMRLIQSGFPPSRIKLLQTVTRKNIDAVHELISFSAQHQIGLSINPVELPPADPMFTELDLRNCTEDEKSAFDMALMTWAGDDPRKNSYSQAVRLLLLGQKPSRITCELGSRQFVIYPDGKVYVCFYQRNEQIGNIFSDKIHPLFSGLWRNKFYQDAHCLSLQCVCMTSTYPEGIITSIFNRLKPH